MSVLDDPKVQAVLEREHELAEEDDTKLTEKRPEIDAAKEDGTFTYDL